MGRRPSGFPPRVPPPVFLKDCLWLAAPVLVLPFSTSALSLPIIFPSPGSLVISRFGGSEKEILITKMSEALGPEMVSPIVRPGNGWKTWVEGVVIHLLLLIQDGLVYSGTLGITQVILCIL